MRVVVRLFATLRDRVGAERAEVDLSPGASIAELLQALAEKFPQIESSLGTSLVAVNQQYAFSGDIINPGDEVAMFPPVSGGTNTSQPEYFAITNEPLDLDEICATITVQETGAVCVFSGAVRGRTIMSGDSRSTEYLHYDAYQPMAENMLRQVAQEIRDKFPKVQGIAIVQRIGHLEVGETTILVACSAGHRDDGCFEGARYGIDRVKEIVPIWKKEVGPDGETWVEGHYRPSPQDSAAPHGRNGQRSASKSTDAFALLCPECGKTYDSAFSGIKCQCGQALEFANPPDFRKDSISADRFDLWRYQKFLTPELVEPVTLGEGWTPLVEASFFGKSVKLKLEGLNPTGSFKDRGASTLVSVLKARGLESVYDDSSGNAGAALAAYTAKAGMYSKLYVPTSASPQKLAQIRVFGAELEAIDGPRSEAAKAAEAAAERGEHTYASHIWNPYSVFAHKTIAFELWEQLSGTAPDAIVLPLGHGSQLLGIARGFDELLQANAISTIPRLYAVQALACAPLWALQVGNEATVAEQPTLAEGIRIIHPIRAKSVLRAITRSLGRILAVSEDEIVDGIRAFARIGHLVEPTSAVVWAAMSQIAAEFPDNARIILIVSGSGQKIFNLEKLLVESSA